MSDTAQRARSSKSATRRYAEAMEALEHAGSEHVVPIREYVRQLRTEASRHRIKARQAREQLKEATNGEG